jgi:hypothetical protein
MLLLIVPEHVWDWHYCSYCFCFLFLGPLFSVLSFLLWSSLWLVEEVLTSLCLFLIMRMEIIQFLWEISFKVESGWVWPVCLFWLLQGLKPLLCSVLRFYFNWDMTIVMQYWGCARHLKGDSWKGSCFVCSRIQWRAISSWLPARSRVCWSSHSCKGTLSSGLLL